MATGLPDDIEERRLMLRRGQMRGFGPGASTTSESFNGGEDDDEPQPTLNERVIQSAPPPPYIEPEPEPERMSNRQQLAEVSLAGDASYSKEFRLDLLHKLLMRKIPLNLIARELGVSVSTVQKDRIALKARLRQTARELNSDELIGTQQAFYDEIQATSLRMVSTDGMPHAMKLAAMRTGLAANADRARFLANAGVFDVLSYRRAENGEDLSDVQMLMQQTTEALASLASLEQEESSPQTVRPRIVARKRPSKAQGFKPYSMEDTGNEPEVMEL